MNATHVRLLGTAVLTVALVSSCKDALGPSLPDVNPATVLFFDDFDKENGSRGIFNWTSFRNWDVTAGCVDLAGNGFWDVQPGKGLYVDLDGTCEEAGTLETKTTFNFQPGSYVLEFWLAGNQRWENRDTVDVSLGTLYEKRFILRKNHPFTVYTESLTVASPTSAKLRFSHHGGDDQGILLDLVRLRRVE